MERDPYCDYRVGYVQVDSIASHVADMAGSADSRDVQGDRRICRWRKVACPAVLREVGSQNRETCLKKLDSTIRSESVKTG